MLATSILIHTDSPVDIHKITECELKHGCRALDVRKVIWGNKWRGLADWVQAFSSQSVSLILSGTHFAELSPTPDLVQEALSSPPAVPTLSQV